MVEGDQVQMHDSLVPYAREFLDAFADRKLLFIGRKYEYRQIEHGDCRAMDVDSQYSDNISLTRRFFLRIKADIAVKKAIKDFRPQLILGAGLSKDQAVQYDAAKAVGAIYIPMIVSPLEPEPKDFIRKRYWKSEFTMLESGDIPYIFTRGEYLRDNILEKTDADPDKVLDYWPMYPEEFYTTPTKSPYISSGPNILWVGRISPEKGAKLIPPIVKHIRGIYPEAKIHILGTGLYEDEIRDALMTFDPKGENWEMVGYIPAEKIAAYYLNCDIHIMTTLDEGFGKVAYEAMLCGAPIIASDIDNLPYLIEDGERGLLAEPGNPESFAEAIDKLLRDRELAKKLGQNAADYARSVKRPTLTSRITDLLEEIESS